MSKDVTVNNRQLGEPELCHSCTCAQLCPLLILIGLPSLTPDLTCNLTFFHGHWAVGGSSHCHHPGPARLLGCLALLLLPLES